MVKSLAGPALVCLFVTTIALAGNAQEKPALDAGRLENPFEKQRVREAAKKEKLSDRAAQREKNRFPIVSSDKVKKLIAEDAADGKVLSLKKERCRVALVELHARFEEYRGGRSPVSITLRSSDRLKSSLLALEPEASTRLAVLEQHLEVAKELERYANSNLKFGTGTVQESAQAKYERLSAEIVLEEMKEELQAKKGGASN